MEENSILDEQTNPSRIDLQQLERDPVMQRTYRPTVPATAGLSLTMTFAESYNSSRGPVDFRSLPQPPPDSQMFNSSGPPTNELIM